MTVTHKFLLSLLASAAYVSAQQLPVSINNTFRVEYDDNVFTTGSSAVGKTDSFKLINQIEFLFDMEQNNTYAGVRYAPSLIWFDDRPGDSTDISHQLDLILSQRFSPRSLLQLRNTLRYTQEPELTDNDVTVRLRNDFLFNSFNANFTQELVPNKTTLRLDGRYVLMRYDDSAVAENNDYDQFAVGADLRYRLSPTADAGGQIRFTTTSYENDLRDFDAFQVGGVFSQVLNPNFKIEARAGIEFRDADNAVEQTSETPYIDFSLVYLVSDLTRLNAGISYANDLSPVNRFAQQERTRIHGSLSHRIAPDVTLQVSGSYAMGSFDLDDATSAFNPDVHTDGDENVIQFAISAFYRLNVRNQLELTWQYTELDSDIRPLEDFERNRVSLAWKYSL